MKEFSIRQIDQPLREAVQPLIDNSWVGPWIAVNGRLWDTRILPGFAALDEDNNLIGYILYAFHNGLCEIMVLESLHEGLGIGTRLIARVKGIAKAHGMKKVVVMTTNDNIGAIRFYQKRGFTLRALRLNKMEASRKIKPAIPRIGNEGIPIRDEIEFEIEL